MTPRFGLADMASVITAMAFLGIGFALQWDRANILEAEVERLKAIPPDTVVVVEPVTSSAFDMTCYFREEQR